jgi:ATPase subunit of ABC transporter with duplicated ATPase domains
LKLGYLGWLPDVWLEPEILAIDEPTNHLDSSGKNQFIRWAANFGKNVSKQ